MISKIVIPIERQSGGPMFQSSRLPRNMPVLLELRAWCRDNIKCPWRTYHLEQSPQAEMTEKFDFIVFEFNDQKDAMLFKLYTGK